ncbi:hypothetical protein [Mesorhizobium sp. M0643]|uniref:hypothetical protein n=1 Tax=Mesorhizobium sp. M0643 TaxID=2956978 RepID=UPI0033396BCF
MIFFEEEFDLLDAFIGEGQNPVVIVGAVHPDDAVLGLETEGQFWMSASLTPRSLASRSTV